MDQEVPQPKTYSDKTSWTTYAIVALLGVIAYLLLSILQNVNRSSNSNQDYTIAYVNPPAIGSQCHQGSLGMEFVVQKPVKITHLGAFDSSQDGFKDPITVQLLDKNTQQIIHQEILFGNQDTLIDGSRFRMLNQPIVLEPSTARSQTYVINAFGYGNTRDPYDSSSCLEPNGNSEGSPPAWFTQNGTNALTFVGTSRFANHSGFPSINDEGPQNRYAAGTFIFVSL